MPTQPQPASSVKGRMVIDVSAQVETAKRLTREWAERAGYQQAETDPEIKLTKRAEDCRRILMASSFGCQERSVHLLIETLLGEKLNVPSRAVMVEYRAREPFAIGSVLVPVNNHDGSGILRPGLVVRLSGSGNAGLRKSSGEMHNNHYQQHDLRPATVEEIDAYYSEFFGLSVNPADMPPPEPEAEPLHDLTPDGSVLF